MITDQKSLDGSIPVQKDTEHKKSEKAFVDYFMYALTAPFIHPPGGWGEDLWTGDKRSQAKIYRLTEHKDIENGMCTCFEAMMYISAVSLDHPLDYDLYNIYMYLFAQYFDYRLISPDRPAPTLVEHEMSILKRFREWMYKIQMEHIKTKGRETKTIVGEVKPKTIPVEMDEFF